MADSTKPRPQWRASALFCIPALALGAPAERKLDEIVVTALPFAQRLEDVAQPTQVLAGDELRRRIEASIGETLARLPGSSATYFGPAASRPVIRGLGGERLQVLENGMGSLDLSALSPDHAVTVEPLLADQVEVLRGPATLLYGNGTVGGVVNVVTSRVPVAAADEALGGAAELRGGGALDERSASGRLDTGAGAFALHLDGYSRQTQDAEIAGPAWSDAIRVRYADAGLPLDDTRDHIPNSDADSQGAGAGASWLFDRGYVGFGYSRLENEYGIPGPAEDPEAGGVRIDMQQDRYDFASQLDNPLKGLKTVRWRASWNDYEHREIEGNGEVGTHFEQRAFETRVSADHAPVAGWHGAVGVQYRDIDLTAIGAEAFVPPSHARHLGLFLFEERSSGTVTWQGGMRLEQQHIDVQAALPDYDEASLNASAGLIWDFRPDYSLALNLTRAERHPAATELYADGPHLAVQRFEIGDDSLESETAFSADLTLRRTAGDWQFALTAFVNRFSDFIYAQSTGAIEDDLFVHEWRQQDADFVGFEAETSFPLRVSDRYRLTARLLADYVRGRLDAAGDIPLMPPLRFGGELGYERDRLQATVTLLRYADQDQVAANELPTDAYTQLDVDLSYHLAVAESARWLMFLRGTNLLDEAARRSASPLKEFAPMPGIGVLAGLRLEF